MKGLGAKTESFLFNKSAGGINDLGRATAVVNAICFHELHQILLDYNPFELKLHTLNNEEEMRM